MWVITFAIFIVLISLLWKLGSYNHGYFRKLGISGPTPWPFLGNLYTLISKGMYGLDLQYTKAYGRIYGTFMGSIPVLIISDRELIRQICIKQAAIFTDRFSLNVENAPLDKAITTLKGTEWKRVRNILTPTFTAGKLKKMTPLIKDAVATLQSRFVKAAEIQEDVEIKSYYSGLALDVIARTMFGMKVDCQENPDDEFYSHSRKLFRGSFANPFLLLLMFWPDSAKYVRRWKPEGFLPKDTRKYFLSAVVRALEERRKAQGVHHDFLALMLRAREKAEKRQTESGTNDPVLNETSQERNEITEEISDVKVNDLVNVIDTKGLSESEMISQSFVFLIAGFETTATTLQFCSYFLAKHPKYQDQCREEIRQFLGEEEPDYDNVSKLQFLEQCIHETLRICPPALRFDRVPNETVKLYDSTGREITIPKGLSVQVAVHAIQNDPEIYEDPDSFDPNRLSPEQMELHKHNYDFMPFGLGPRNCIGMRFALLEIKLLLATVLRTMKFVPCAKTCEKLEFAQFGLLTSKIPIVLRVETAA
jgi:cytochrome P450